MRRFETRRLLLFGALVLLAILLAAPATLRAEISDSLEASEHVEVFDGDMPLMFAVGHGGWKQLGEQENGGYSADPLLRDYFYRVLAVRIYEKTGHLPYIVYQQGNRNYVNTNRPVDHPEAYHPDNTEARDAYFEFHNQVDAMIGRIEDEYGADMALMVNPHTTDLAASGDNRPWDRIADIGFIASVTNLGSARNTMKALYDRKGETALRGRDSVPYQFFHGQDWPTPGAVWPAAATINSKTLAKTGDDVWHVLPAWVTGWGTDNWVTAYYNGYATVMYHGTNCSGHHANWSNGLDAFQIEVNYTKDAGIALDEPSSFQLDVPFTTDLMDDFIDAIIHCLQTNYNWTPGGVYNVVIDNGDEGFSTTSSWAVSQGQGFWGTPSIYTDEPGATATWTPNLAQAGTYEVLIRWTKSGSRTDHAEYTVSYAGGSQTFTTDQSEGQDAKWVSLGQFPFNAGTTGSVVLECTGTGDSTAADAALFRLVEEQGNQAPTASFIADPPLGEPPLAVSFDATGSTDPDGTIESYDWDFGDGSAGTVATGRGVTITHTFDLPGEYTVALTVTDNEWVTDTDTIVIGVRLPALSGDIIIDNLDAEFTATGDWYESYAADEYAGSSLYAMSDGATATWTPNLSEAGVYRVFAWWTYWSTRAEHAPYTIIHADGSDTVRVNQRENTGQWVLLGVYEFNAGTAALGSVTVTREDEDGVTTNADAVRFTRVVPAQGVEIQGPTICDVNTACTFTATVLSATVTSPTTYTWSPAPTIGQGSPAVTYTWSTAGSKGILVTTTSDQGEANDIHIITVKLHKIHLPLILR